MTNTKNRSSNAEIKKTTSKTTSKSGSVSTARDVRFSWSFTGTTALITMIFSLVALVFFFLQPLTRISGEEQVTRALFAFLPVLTPGSFTVLLNTFSDTTSAFDCRVVVLCWKWIALLAVFGVGYLLLRWTGIHSLLNQPERLFFSLVTGIACWSLLLFLLSWCGWIRCFILIKILTAGAALAAFWFLREEQRRIKRSVTSKQTRQASVYLLLLLPFIILYSLGSLIPTSEYDMLEYHLQSAREILESGRLTFYSHNVYMNMPLGTEMLYLWGSLLYGSGMESVLVGKALVSVISLVTALGVYSFVFRWFRSFGVGLTASLIYLSFIWNFQVFATGLNDGVLGMASFAAFYALSFLIQKEKTQKASLLAGFCVGYALSVKYTAVVFLLIPLSIVLTIFLVVRYLKSGRGKKTIRTLTVALIPLGLFLMTTVIMGGGWYLKNWTQTGNPVYPLAWQVFGDSTKTWTTEKNDRWQKAHSPDHRTMASFVRHVGDFIYRDDFSSPFLVLFCVVVPGASLFFLKQPKNLLTHRRSWIWFATLGYVILFTLIWGFCTHRLLRFMVPLLPWFAVLTAGALALFERKIYDRKGPEIRLPVFRYGRRLCIILLIFCGWYSFFLAMVNQKDYLVSPALLEKDPLRFSDWSIWFNEHSQCLKEGEKLLLLGEANAFAFQVPILYSTCWDNSPFMTLLYETVKEENDKIYDIKDKEKLKKRLTAAGIKYILVNEAELDRFRSPGNYGFSDPEIDLSLLELLVEKEILTPFYPPEWSMFQPGAKERIKVYQVP